MGVPTLEDPHGGRVVVDPSGSPQGGSAHGRRRDKIVGESIVQVTLEGKKGAVSGRLVSCAICSRSSFQTYLKLEDVLHIVEFLLVSAVR